MTVLILGAGQLARMLSLAGAPLGIQVWAVDVASEQVLEPVSKLHSSLTLAQAIEQAQVISVEFEHIPEPLLQRCAASGKLRPGIEAIRAGADRVKEKALLDSLGIANCTYQIIGNTVELPAAVNELGESLVIKASRDGYDGYGQWRLTSQADLPALQQQLGELDLAAVPLVAEKMLHFERELSLVGARNAKGDCCFYPLADNAHYQGQLQVTLAPATQVTDALQQQAESIFTRLANALDYVGVLAVEFFQVGEQLLVNEIAPRVHNSGHWSMQGTACSQFENHLRAILDLPLGDTRATGVSAMLNVIGTELDVPALLAEESCYLHWYGKSLRAKRKMGHINVQGQTMAQLTDRLARLSAILPAAEFPLLDRQLKKLQA